MSNLYLRAAGKFLQLPLLLAVFVFLPAGTLDYWEGWLLSAVFIGCSLAITLYLAINDPQLLERRARVGPRAETERAQKTIVFGALLTFAALPILSATDHRLGWSTVPAPLVLVGDMLIALAFIGFFFVFRANPYGAATIQVAEGQTVISTGPNAVVRHPMYGWALVMILGIVVGPAPGGACRRRARRKAPGRREISGGEPRRLHGLHAQGAVPADTFGVVRPHMKAAG